MAGLRKAGHELLLPHFVIFDPNPPLTLMLYYYASIYD